MGTGINMKRRPKQLGRGMKRPAGHYEYVVNGGVASGGTSTRVFSRVQPFLNLQLHILLVYSARWRDLAAGRDVLVGCLDLCGATRHGTYWEVTRWNLCPQSAAELEMVLASFENNRIRSQVPELLIILIAQAVRAFDSPRIVISQLVGTTVRRPPPCR